MRLNYVFSVKADAPTDWGEDWEEFVEGVVTEALHDAMNQVNAELGKEGVHSEVIVTD